MIITKTPLRISFVGGGTDIASFYKEHPGAVVSTAIDKYVYVTINKNFDSNGIRVAYSKTELVNDIKKVQHPIVREAMKLTGIIKGIEITTMADVPSKGTGLGSSSSFTVGLLNALYAYKGNLTSSIKLAEEACHVEIDRLKEPIGKQDQYIAARGGFQFIEFLSDGTVLSDPVLIDEHVKKRLEKNLMLFYTGQTRSAKKILAEQGKKSKENFQALMILKGLAIELRRQLLRKNIEQVGELMHENWRIKQKLSSKITDNQISGWYNDAIKAGAIGGKICGAGGGGFLLFYCPIEQQPKVRKNIPLREIKFKFEPQGSRIIHVGD